MGNYLYNGIPLPKAPVVPGHSLMTLSRREYSGEEVTNRYFLAAYEYSHYWEKEYTVPVLGDYTKYYFGSENGAPAVVLYECLDGTSEWVKTDQTSWQVTTYDSRGEIGEPPLWANFDVLAPDGSVYLEASYPIDEETGKAITIYDPNVPVLNPTALLSSFFVGQAIRRMRGG